MDKEEKKKCDEPIFKCETHENMSLTNSLHVCTINQETSVFVMSAGGL